MIGRISMILSIALCGCTAYFAYTYRPDLEEQPTDQAKYKADLRACQNELAAKPDADTPFVPFTLSGYRPSGSAQGDDSAAGAQDSINRCMAGRGYAIKPS